MIEVAISYDLQPGIEPKSYTDWARATVVVLLKSSGIIEFRARRNLLGSPHILLISVWESLADWAALADRQAWISMMDELRNRLAINIDCQIWGMSPITPEPLRPKK